MPVEYVIKDDGQVYERTLAVDRPINILPSIQRTFQSDARTSIRSLMDLSEMGEPFFGKVSISSSMGAPTIFWASVRVKTLNLNTTFDMVEGILTPRFKDGGVSLNLPWRMPDDMCLVLGFHITHTDRGCILGKHYLIAYDEDKRTWRLPIANVYDHLELCHGQSNQWHGSLAKAVIVACNAFRNSSWNQDLSNLHHQDKTNAMFQFKPLNTSFEQIPAPLKTWTQHCSKVSNEIINTNFTPVPL